MQNPFTSNQIRNYLLLYAAVIVIMAIFYLLNSNFNQIAVHDKKVFKDYAEKSSEKENAGLEKDAGGSSIHLLEKAY